MTLPTLAIPATQPPAWCGPVDEEGTALGPHVYFGPLGVLTAWTPEDGPHMWLDTTLVRGSMDLTPDSARALAATLTRFAGLVDSVAPSPVLVAS
jgi:hypothetical protein